MSTFDILSPGGQPIFLARLPNERGGGKPYHQYVSNEAELQKFIAEHDRDGFALYRAAAILKNGEWRKKENVQAVRYIWAEVDLKDHPELSREEIRQRLDTIPLRPTLRAHLG